MRYYQSRQGTKVELFLKRESLEYRYKGPKSEYTMFLDYEQIPFEEGKLLFQGSWLRNTGVGLIALGTFLTIYSQIVDKEATAWLWIIIGGFCCFWYYFRKVEFYFFDTPKGRILIICDKQGDEAAAMIRDRRRQQIRRRHGAINWKNDPEHELQRFRWMEERNVISPGEYREVEAMIRKSLKGRDSGLEEAN